jgi:hypothetical protein
VGFFCGLRDGDRDYCFSTRGDRFGRLDLTLPCSRLRLIALYAGLVVAGSDSAPGLGGSPALQPGASPGEPAASAPESGESDTLDLTPLCSSVHFVLRP